MNKIIKKWSTLPGLFYISQSYGVSIQNMYEINCTNIYNTVYNALSKYISSIIHIGKHLNFNSEIAAWLYEQ